MNVPIELVGVFATAFLGLQGWMLFVIYSMRGEFAALSQKVTDQKEKYEAIEDRVNSALAARPDLGGRLHHKPNHGGVQG